MTTTTTTTTEKEQARDRRILRINEALATDDTAEQAAALCDYYQSHGSELPLDVRQRAFVKGHDVRYSDECDQTLTVRGWKIEERILVNAKVGKLATALAQMTVMMEDGCVLRREAMVELREILQGGR